MRNIYDAFISGLAFWLADAVGWIQITQPPTFTENVLVDELIIALLIGVIFTVVGRLYLEYLARWLYNHTFHHPLGSRNINANIARFAFRFHLASLLVGPIGFLIFWIFIPQWVSSTSIYLLPVFGFIVVFFWNTNATDFSREN